jgi:hypothetical protein
MADPTLVLRFLSLACAASAVALLAGCAIVPDTGATDPDRFVKETAPVYYRPDGQGQGEARWCCSRIPASDPRAQVQDFFRTRFHHTYACRSPGLRAMYIYKNGNDTIYRIHGMPEWQSIGKATSSGCVRMLNQDVIDLYPRLAVKVDIVVQQAKINKFS